MELSGSKGYSPFSGSTQEAGAWNQQASNSQKEENCQDGGRGVGPGCTSLRPSVGRDQAGRLIGLAIAIIIFAVLAQFVDGLQGLDRAEHGLPVIGRAEQLAGYLTGPLARGTRFTHCETLVGFAVAVVVDVIAADFHHPDIANSFAHYVQPVVGAHENPLVATHALTVHAGLPDLETFVGFTVAVVVDPIASHLLDLVA